MTDLLLRYGLLIYFCAYFALAFVWRSVRVYQSHGVNPFVLPSNDDAYGYVGLAFKGVVAACAVFVVLITFFDQATVWLGAYVLFQSVEAFRVGWILLCVSLLWLLLAQAQMGASWRIGIDHARPTALVQHGLFSLSRNPIFLAMRCNLLGFFLVFPSAATLALLVAGEILMQVQVRLEEVHLRALHGADYDAYCARVRRWL
jgi:protein-S-isoprenylcysteine O-methyltransferase Ste14